MFDRFAKYLLELEKNPRISDLQIAGMILGLMITSVSGTLVFVSLQEPPPKESEIPMQFSIYDAETICMNQMRHRLGKTLLRYHLDTHSSRLDRSAGIYRLYLNADIGKLDNYNEVSVHCFISLSGKNLAHYRQYGLSSKVKWSTNISFF